MSIVIVLLLIFTLLGGAILFMATEHMKNSNLAQKKEQDYYNCESALLYLYATNNYEQFDTEATVEPTVTLPDNCKFFKDVKVTWNATSKKLKAVGKFRACEMEIGISANNNSNSGGEPAMSSDYNKEKEKYNGNEFGHIVANYNPPPCYWDEQRQMLVVGTGWNQPIYQFDHMSETSETYKFVLEITNPSDVPIPLKLTIGAREDKQSYEGILNPGENKIEVPDVFHGPNYETNVTVDWTDRKSEFYVTKIYIYDSRENLANPGSGTPAAPNDSKGVPPYYEVSRT